jgi:hypothetical protein
MPAVGLEAHEVGLGAALDLDVERALDRLNAGGLDFLGEGCNRLPAAFEGSKALLNEGKTAREVNHRIAALAR